MGWSERISAGRFFASVALFTSLVATGCSGDKNSGSGSGSGSAVAKTLPPLSVDRGLSLPGSWRHEQRFVKPGHWSAAWFEAASNVDDFQGELELRLEDRSQGESAEIGPGVRRPIVLPRGEPRPIEVTYFPSLRKSETKETNASGRPWTPKFSPPPSPPEIVCTVSLHSRGGRRADLTTSMQTSELKNHQAIFGVLSSHPEHYNFYAGLDVVLAPSPEHGSSDGVHYRLVIADDPLRVPLPSQSTAWTTVAYLVWDGFDPGRLSDAQREAMIDWLHWGGQLLVSGPESLATLERSFLGPYLPARGGPTVTLDAPALEPLGEWVPPRGKALNPSHAWPAVTLLPQDRSVTLVPDDGKGRPLVVERRIGRGRMVVTAFGLAERDLVDWPSFDSLLHGCLMRRPPRTVTNYNAEGLRWADNHPWYDPTRITGVSYVARDEGRWGRADNRGELDSMIDMHPNSGPGVAAWRDDGKVVERARDVLSAEAGILIPDARFVIWVVAIYFVVLVPLNWLVFRLLGKPEWAWFAAPLIAVACSAAVIRLAQLDVGFSRSASEVTIVELQPEFSRAHVSRFVAVYNSLGTEYEIRGDDPSTTALPLAAYHGGPTDPSSWRIVRGAEGAEAGTTIHGFLVASNSAALVRAEQMRDVGGGIRIESLGDGVFRLTNGTRLELTDCRISGSAAGRFERLPAGGSAEIKLARRPSFARNTDQDTAVERLRGLLEGRGTDELRLTAQANDDVGGFAFAPQPSQFKRMTFVVAHLEYHDDRPQVDRGGRNRFVRPEPTR